MSDQPVPASAPSDDPAAIVVLDPTTINEGVDLLVEWAVDYWIRRGKRLAGTTEDVRDEAA